MARIGIVGTGWGARVQVPTFREAGLEVVGIAGSNADRTKGIAAELGVRAFDDWRALVGDPSVDLVSVATPPSEHLEMARAALEAGKHVLCEKPTAMNAGEAEQLVAAAKKHPDRITLIDHELRFLPSWREARALIRELGELGDVRYAEVRYSSPARGDRSREWNWWADAKRGGGIWGAVGSHFIDALRYFGMEPESVQALLATIVDRRPFGDETREVTADDWGSVQFRMRGRAVAVMTFSAVATGPDEPAVMTIYGEKGSMRFSGEEVLLSTGGRPFQAIAGNALEKRPGNSPGGAFGAGTLHLGRALRAALDDGDREALAPAATFEDGLVQQRVLDAARKSASGGGWVAV
jgi:predicted dehydrogenase